MNTDHRSPIAILYGTGTAQAGRAIDAAHSAASDPRLSRNTRKGSLGHLMNRFQNHESRHFIDRTRDATGDVAARLKCPTTYYLVLWTSWHRARRLELQRGLGQVLTYPALHSSVIIALVHYELS